MRSLPETARRSLALIRSVAASRRRPPSPFKLTWILGETCSLRCRTCHLWHAPHPGPTPHQVGQVVQANPGLTWVNLSGGDFVERSDAAELVSTVVDGLPDLTLLDFPTAGQDPDALMAALEPALASAVPWIFVTVSLDGPDDVHDELRGQSGAAARARACLRQLESVRRRGFRVVAGMTLSRHNVHPNGLPEHVLPLAVPARNLHLNLAHHSGHYYRNEEDVAPPVTETLALLEAHKRRRGPAFGPLALVESLYWRRARDYLIKGDPGGACGALLASVYLASDLTVYPCSIHDRPLGKLADHDWSLARACGSSLGRAARAEAEARSCPGCWTPCEAFPTLLAGLGRPL